MTGEAQPVLSVRNLTVALRTPGGDLRPVDGVSFSLGDGEIFGLVGESGAGKSLTAASILNLLDPPARIAAGEVWFEGRRIDNLPANSMRELRGRRIGWVVQNPAAALNPLKRIGDALVATLTAHSAISPGDARRRSLELLEAVGIPDPELRLEQYPHQFSGGMLQRVVIAMAIAHDPRLIIADEPTSALDVSTQLQIIELLQGLVRERGITVLLISHNISLVAKICSRIAVIYAGRIVEIGPALPVISAPRHPYTQGLVQSVPRLGSRQPMLTSIPGSAPRLSEMPPGCAFYPRCDRRVAICAAQRPPLAESIGRADACWVAQAERT